MEEGISSYNGRSTFYEYFKRGLNYKQWDIETSLWQMLNLCINPRKVYSNFKSHKQTKQQWARDDPSFSIMLIFLMILASIAYFLAFSSWHFFELVKLLFWTIFVDFFVVGSVVATIGWWVANSFLRDPKEAGNSKVEWLYAFDIHCNSFFPLYLMLYVGQFVLIWLLYTDSFISTLLSNTLYIVSLGYYYYITFLGYTALKFLQNTQFLMLPYLACVVIYFVLTGLNYNATAIVIHFYFGRPL